jgi:hypothetical protein
VSLWHRRFAAEVERHTEEARRKFGDDHDSPYYWLGVLTEEVGKLSRAVNKLNIAVDLDVRAQWTREGRHRLTTIASLARRMAERWPELAKQSGQ